MTRPLTAPGRLVAGRYRLLSRIGGGGMGTVWLGRDELLGRQVAVKQVLPPVYAEAREAERQRARALREGRIAARLSTPHAISVYDVVVENEQPWLVMEYLPSRSLAAVLAEDGLLRVDQVAQIGAQVADGLAATHAAGIVHRDVKPANILIGHGERVEGLVKITDFGISHANGDVTLTQTGQITGTPAFLAPEVAQGEEPTSASDVFSLGATLYTCLEGQPPFGMGDNALQLLHKVAGGVVAPPRYSGSMTGPLLRMLAADPADRPPMREVRDELARLAAGRDGDPTTVLMSRTRLRSAPGRLRTAEFPPIPPPTPLPPPEPEEAAPGAGDAAPLAATAAPLAEGGAAVAADAAPVTDDAAPVTDHAAAPAEDTPAPLGRPGALPDEPAGGPRPEPTPAPGSTSAPAAAGPPPRPAGGPPDDGEPPGRVGADEEARGGRRRRLVPVGIAAVVVAAVAALVAVLLTSGGGTGGSTTRGRAGTATAAPTPTGGVASTPPTSSAPSPSSSVAPSASPSASSAPSPTTASPSPTAATSSPTGTTSSPVGAASGDPATFLAEYHSLLPGNTQAAYALTGPDLRASVSYSGYQSFWHQFSAVHLAYVRVQSATSASGEIDYTYPDGSVQRELHQFTLTRGSNGQLLLDRDSSVRVLQSR